MAALLWTVLLSPLAGAVLNGFVLPRQHRHLSHGVGVVAMLVAFAAAVGLWMTTPHSAVLFSAGPWIKAGTLDIPLHFVLDPLSKTMLLIITGIGSLIHLYAGGYMSEEAVTYRFFAYLNLFVFMMLILVLGDSLALMFVGWEGVGLCSYLLIGYWV